MSASKSHPKSKPIIYPPRDRHTFSSKRRAEREDPSTPKLSRGKYLNRKPKTNPQFSSHPPPPYPPPSILDRFPSRASSAVSYNYTTMAPSNLTDLNKSNREKLGIAPELPGRSQNARSQRDRDLSRGRVYLPREESPGPRLPPRTPISASHRDPSRSRMQLPRQHSPTTPRPPPHRNPLPPLPSRPPASAPHRDLPRSKIQPPKRHSPTPALPPRPRSTEPPNTAHKRRKPGPVTSHPPLPPRHHHSPPNPLHPQVHPNGQTPPSQHPRQKRHKPSRLQFAIPSSPPQPPPRQHHHSLIPHRPNPSSRPAYKGILEHAEGYTNKLIDRSYGLFGWMRGRKTRETTGEKRRRERELYEGRVMRPVRRWERSKAERRKVGEGQSGRKERGEKRRDMGGERRGNGKGKEKEKEKGKGKESRRKEGGEGKRRTRHGYKGPSAFV